MEPTLFSEDNRAFFENYVEQTQCVLLRMLKIFDTICSKYDIDYWLDYGTLLGAVRHRGFIPWDVEADVGMLRSDFEVFLQKGPQNLPMDIFWQTGETDHDYLPSSYFIEAKLRDKYSNYSQWADNNRHCKWHNGIQIDIFVYDLDNVLDNCLTNAYERILSDRRIYLKREELEYLERQPFADYSFPIPAGSDAYLKRNYDDYWQLPPMDKRVSEVVEVFSACNHREILHWNAKAPER